MTSLLFDKRPLMLMEQPEDSVHPGLLRKVIDIMRSYSHSSQIIFTTHSSEVLDILQPGRGADGNGPWRQNLRAAALD